jgi:aspartyl-tRNA(Asn)/glutamyl-tRNA(Gln) amidotransferase subunit A
MSYKSIYTMSASALSTAIRTKKLSPVEVTDAFLSRIDEQNEHYFGFVLVTPERARKDAKKAEKEIMAGEWRGPLHGLPYGAKDIIETAGIRTTNGAKVCENNVPVRDAHCISSLTNAGAILLGKTNTHQWAAASTTINQHFGTSKNPWDPSRTVGGSSGGSAAAIASCMCPLALGTDTGGSIRTPAALCGIVGLKPTHGRISLRGICPNAPTFDHPGPMSSEVADAALMLQVLAGYDPLESHSSNRPVPDYLATIDKGVNGATIIISPDFNQNKEIDNDISKAFERVIATLIDLGAKVETRHFPDPERFHTLFRQIAGPEFSEVHRPLYERDPNSFEADVLHRIEWSLKIKTDDYVRALRARSLLIREVEEFFAGADAMISPSIPFTAPSIKTLSIDINGKPYNFLDQLHRPFLSCHNVTGCPALVIPMGLNASGMPMSVQISAGRWREDNVLRIGQALETSQDRLFAPDLTH